VPIAGDAAIAQRGVGEGKLIPLLILDTRERPEIEELIRVHEHLPPGDVTSQWGQIEGKTGTVALILQFKRPVSATAIIEFSIIGQGILVDQILGSGGVYLQAGSPGHRFISDPDARKILVDIVEGGFSEAWDAMWYKSLTSDMRAKGLKRSEARHAARQVMDELRSFARRSRMPN